MCFLFLVQIMPKIGRRKMTKTVLVISTYRSNHVVTIFYWHPAENNFISWLWKRLLLLHNGDNLVQGYFLICEVSTQQKKCSKVQTFFLYSFNLSQTLEHVFQTPSFTLKLSKPILDRRCWLWLFTHTSIFVTS